MTDTNPEYDTNTEGSLTGLNIPSQTELRLPRPLTDMMKTDENEILQLHIVRTGANHKSRRIGVLFIDRLVLCILTIH
jgi:hypothetical protein